MVLGRASALLA
jgi:hypothetical protein